MNTAEQNYRLLQEIDSNREFMMLVYRQNPMLLARAELRIRQMFEAGGVNTIEGDTGSAAIPNPSPLATPMTARQRGGSLVELIMFIVIVSVALAGILLVMNQTTRGSADPLLRKQAIAAAYSLLEEIELQHFYPASGAVAAGTVTTANRANAYHIVSDYHGFATTGIYSLTGIAPVAGLANYNVSVAVTPEAAVWNGIPAASVLLIAVTVTTPAGETITATGYRTAY